MKTAVQHLSVGPQEAGQKLFQYLARRLGPGAPKAAVLRWIRTGQVRVDGRRAKPFDRLEQGAVVRLPPFEAPETPDAPGRAAQAATPPAEPGTAAGTAATPGADRAESGLHVLFEDERFLAVAKPAGLPVHPGTGWSDCLSARLAAHCPGAPFVPTPAHRLDRDTSGVLVAAKSYQALRALQDAFRERRAVKEYLAWVRGAFDLCAWGESARLRDLLEKSGPAGGQRVRVGRGKPTETLASPLCVEKDASLLLLRILTGRTHQIRVQLASRGFPLVGDPKYGGGRPPLLLHAWRLSVLGQTWTCPPPWPAPWLRPLPDNQLSIPRREA